MEFEWDERKRQENLAKHGVDFIRSVAIFAQPVVLSEDDRLDYGEIRQIAIGFVDADCYVVVFTERDGAFRIISARPGGRRDRRKYQTHFAR